MKFSSWKAICICERTEAFFFVRSEYLNLMLHLPIRLVSVILFKRKKIAESELMRAKQKKMKQETGKKKNYNRDRHPTVIFIRCWIEWTGKKPEPRTHRSESVWQHYDYMFNDFVDCFSMLRAHLTNDIRITMLYWARNMYWVSMDRFTLFRLQRIAPIFPFFYSFLTMFANIHWSYG